MERNDRDVFLAIVSGVAVGLLALAFPSPIAFLGLIPGIIASLDLARRRQLTAVGVLLLAAALTAGLPSGWTLFGPDRVAGAGLPAAVAAVFGAACGALILGVMVLLLEPSADGAPPAEPRAAPVAPDPSADPAPDAPADRVTEVTQPADPEAPGTTS